MMNKHAATAWLASLISVGSFLAQPAYSAEYIQGTPAQQKRAFSPGVITEGGRIVWLAGQTATEDLNGKSIVGDFDAQARTIFKLMEQTLKRAGGSLSDLVTMTVFINDPRNGDRLVEIRKEMFPDGHFPGSALLTLSNFARPGMMLEITGIAVIGEKN